jgi:hypothetical protein
MSWFSQRRWAQIVILTAAASGAGVLAPRSAQAVSTGNSPSSVSGCSSNFHIGSYSSNRITAVDSRGLSNDFGWFEWRYSNTGACKGHQWVRLHVESRIPFEDNYFYTKYWRTNDPSLTFYFPITPSLRNTRYDGPVWSAYVNVLSVGAHDGKLLYSPTTKSCATFDTDVLVGFDIPTLVPLRGKQCA